MMKSCKPTKFSSMLVGAPLFLRSRGLMMSSFLTNSSMMDVDFLPEHLVIIGGSYVGLEFAQMYRRFGSEVTIVEMGPRLIGREDEDVSEAVREILEMEGIQIRLNAKCISLAKRDSRIAVGVECDEGPPEVSGTHVLLAVGRTPNTNDLGLDQAGVATDQRGYIIVDDQLQTNVPGIWALGDCNGRGAFTHTSYNDYEIVADNLLERRPSPRVRPNPDVRFVYRSAAGPMRHDGRRNTEVRARCTRCEISDEPSEPGR